jgi:competence protein ComEC
LYLPGTLALCLVASIAYSLTFLHTEIFSPYHFSHVATNRNFLVAILDQPTIEKEKTYRAIVKVKEVVSSSGFAYPVKGRLLVSFSKNGSSKNLRYGSLVLIPAKYYALEPPKNPEQFNYKEFMSFQNVYHQAFLKQDEWKLLSQQKGNIFWNFIYQLREHLFTQIVKHVNTTAELGVASALMLGYKDFITPEVTQAYAASGALHVLCVSGLHVGMVFLVLSNLLFFLNKTRQLRVLQTILIVAFIWCYACITGLSPSVMRAATMFSMMALGKHFSNQPNMFNTIGASALILMIFNPFIMTEVGFKLSYLAVIGIVYLQPLIVKWFSFKWWLLQKAWQITAVSIAAQAATFPLGLYYFHQFPSLFLVSNLVVIPVGWLLINLGIAMFALVTMPVLQMWIGKLFYWFTFALNKFIFWLDEVPYSMIQGVSISWIELLAIYAIVLLAASLMLVLKPKPLLLLLGILLMLLIWNGYEKIEQNKQQMVVCYAVKGNKAIAIIEGTNAYIDFDSLLYKNESSMLFNIKHHWWKLGIKKVLPMHEFKNYFAIANGYAFEFKNKRFVVFNSNENLSKKYETKFQTDVLLLSKNARVDLDKTLRIIEPKTIVADASNKSYKVEKWQQAAEVNAVEFLDVAQMGAVVW